MQAPTIGRVVLVHGLESNGSKVQAALVTAAFSPTCVNVTAFPDAGRTQPVAKPVVCLTSVPFFQTREEGEKAGAAPYFAFWPPREAASSPAPAGAKG